MSKKTFKLKLIVSYVIIVVVSFAFIAFFLDRNLERNSLQEIQSSLVTQAHLIENLIPLSSIKAEDSASLESLVDNLRPTVKCRMTIISLKGKVLADSEKTLQDVPKMESHLTRPEVRTALNNAVGIDTRYSNTLKINMLYVAVPLKDKNEIVAVLRLALPLKSVQSTLFTIRKTVFLGLFFALFFAFIFGTFVAGKTIQPINRIIQAAHKYAEGDFSRRIILSSNDEIGELGDTLNKMAQDIEDSIKEIKTQNQKLATIFDSMIEGVLVTDKRGHIVSLNSSIEKIFDVSAQQAKGKLFIEAIRNNDISEIINNVLKSGKTIATEINLLLPVKRIFQINAAPIFADNDVIGCLAVIHDITEVRKLENLRKDFVANVSHELKTPLTSIKGFVETLLEGALDDKENNRNFLKIIQNHADRLNSLVDDLLSLSFLESKEITLQKKDVDLRQELEAVIAGFKTQLKKKTIEISNQLPEKLYASVDPDKMEHVFNNLIDNALKFNNEGGSIKVHGQIMQDAIQITIEDTGIGIPQRDIPRIFERFYRVDKARSRQLGGTGLGLSIVKHIVELHGGSVGVESTEGLGSKFFFTLPK